MEPAVIQLALRRTQYCWSLMSRTAWWLQASWSGDPTHLVVRLSSSLMEIGARLTPRPEYQRRMNTLLPCAFNSTSCGYGRLDGDCSQTAVGHCFDSAFMALIKKTATTTFVHMHGAMPGSTHRQDPTSQHQCPLPYLVQHQCPLHLPGAPQSNAGLAA